MSLFYKSTDTHIWKIKEAPAGDKYILFVSGKGENYFDEEPYTSSNDLQKLIDKAEIVSREVA